VLKQSKKFLFERIKSPGFSKQLWVLIIAGIVTISWLGAMLVLMSGEQAHMILSVGITLCAATIVAIVGYVTWITSQNIERISRVSTGLHSIDTGVLFLDSDGTVAYYNDPMNKFFGIIDLNFFDNTLPAYFVPETNFDFKFLATELQKGQKIKVYSLLKSNAGTTVSWQISAFPLPGDGGSVWFFSPGTTMEEEVKDIRFLQIFQNFYHVFDQAPMSIALLDSHGHVIVANKKFYQDLNQEETTGLFFEMVSESCRSDVASSLNKVLAGEQISMPIEMSFGEDDPKLMSAFATRIALNDSKQNGECGVIMHLFDSTSQKNLHLQLVQSQKMQAMGQLAGGIAHDFNNLLTAMIGFCDLLLMRHSPGDQSFTDIMQIKQNANRAANLVRQLLAFSKQQTLQPQILDVSESVSELSVLLQRLVGVDIDLDIVFGRDVGNIKVDKGQFEQVVINLVVNARDAMDEKGHLSIQTNKRTYSKPTQVLHETIPAGSYAEIKVTDTGCGITKENLPRIFDPFFSTKEVGQGTGLGLSTVYGIVKQTGGHIFVDSKFGKGTIFTVLFPIYKQEEETQTLVEEKGRDKKQPVGDLTGSEKIMIVEDEDAVRLFGARALRDKGYEVIEMRSGDEALSYVQSLSEQDRSTIDLIISDVVMPGMDGPALIKELYELSPDLKVIYISGYAEDSFRQRVGGDEERIHFLPKPFSLKALAIKVKEVLNERPHIAQKQL
jgi:two-component system cell cycle sensor histidine kinase/response regulator CckA